MHEQSVPEQPTPTDVRAPESGAATRNEAPAANTNADRAAKRQMALAAPSKSVAQDELQAADKATEQSAADAQFLGGAKLAGNAQNDISEQGAGTDSAGVQIEARRARSQASSGATISAAAPAPASALQSTVPMAAARLVDPAAELRHAAGSGDMPALRGALERRPLIDARDADGRSALMLAVLHGRGDAVDALLAAGADPNAADVHGVTPLQTALNGEQADIAAALRRAGAR